MTDSIEEFKPKEEEISKVRMNLWMSKKLFSYVEYVASRDDKSMSDVVRDAIKDFMKKDKKKSEETVGA